jgi:hypothetical protein
MGVFLNIKLNGQSVGHASNDVVNSYLPHVQMYYERNKILVHRLKMQSSAHELREKNQLQTLH